MGAFFVARIYSLWYTISKILITIRTADAAKWRIPMIRLNNLTLSPGEDQEQLKRKAAKLLGVSPDSFTAFSLSRQSIDARKKSDVKLVYSVDLSHPAEHKLKLPKQASLFAPQPYRFPDVQR